MTMQTFPFALEAIRKTRAWPTEAVRDHRRRGPLLPDRRGQPASCASVLTAEELADLDDGGEIDTEAMLAAEMEARADSPNLSFFAFTATPKAKTLELFGRKDGDGLPRPFHVYSMQQAIEEGYILDVLRNYTTYDIAFKIAQRSKINAPDRGEAGRRVRGHQGPDAVGVAAPDQHRPEGPDHRRALPHQRASPARRPRQGHGGHRRPASTPSATRRRSTPTSPSRATSIGTLVAFSGSISVDDVAFAKAEPPYTETNLNPGLRGRTPAGRVRHRPVRDPDRGQQVPDRVRPAPAVRHVRRQAALRCDGGADAVPAEPHLRGGRQGHHLHPRLRQRPRRDPRLVPALLPRRAASRRRPTPTSSTTCRPSSTPPRSTPTPRSRRSSPPTSADKHGAITAPLKAAADRFNSRYTAAVEDGDKATVEELDLFRKDVGSFVRLYDFLSQIVNYADTGLEKRSLFLRLLLPAADRPGRRRGHRLLHRRAHPHQARPQRRTHPRPRRRRGQAR